MPTVGDVTGHPAPRHRLRLAFALFLLAPLVGEYLLGNQPVSALPWLLLLAPMYGGGALLVRETARRTGRGWAAMVLLGAAYALIEEGPIDQMLWNPHYAGVDAVADGAKPANCVVRETPGRFRCRSRAENARPRARAAACSN